MSSCSAAQLEVWRNRQNGGFVPPRTCQHQTLRVRALPALLAFGLRLLSVEEKAPVQPRREHGRCSVGRAGRVRGSARLEASREPGAVGSCWFYCRGFPPRAGFPWTR